MNLEIIRSEYFTAAFKKLSKRYRGIVDDYESFLEDLKAAPHQGVEIAPHIRKVRMAITAKGKGKSGGARVITFDALVSEQGGKLYLLFIYDKAEASNVKMNVIKAIIKELGL